MNVEVTNEWYTVEKCKENENSLYVYGDNAMRYGKGGQAVIRDESNSIGLATKFSPIKYFDDDDYFTNIKIINNDIFRIREMYVNNMYDSVVFPNQGLGTGLSNMQQECPRTFLYLCTRLLDEFGFNNLSNLKSK